MKLFSIISIIIYSLAGIPDNFSGQEISWDNKKNLVKEESLLGQMAPGFSLTDLEGETVTLESFKGKFVVLHIATTWCPFCNAEAPYLEKMNKDYPDDLVQVLIIDVKEPGSLVRSRLQMKFNLTFPVLLDADGMVAAKYAPADVLPDLGRDEVMIASNLLIDPKGRVQFISLLDTRSFDAQLIQLKEKLDELLGNKIN